MAVSPRERNMLIVLGVLLVVAGAFFLLTRGGGAPEEAAPTPTASPPPAVTSPPPGPPPDREPPPRAFGFFGGRDPFVPLVSAEAGAGGAATEPAEVGEEPIEPIPPGAEEDEQEGITMGGERVAVVDVFVRGGEEVVQVTVGDRSFVVGEGETFAQNFKVVAINDPCATFLFGDQQFTLCEPGEKK